MQDPLLREIEELENKLRETRHLAEHYHTHALSLITAYRSAGTTDTFQLADTIDALEELNKDAVVLLPALRAKETTA